MTRERAAAGFLTIALLAVLFDVLSSRWDVFTALVMLAGAVMAALASTAIFFALAGPEVEP